jgi:hypothetical protein
MVSNVNKPTTSGGTTTTTFFFFFSFGKRMNPAAEITDEAITTSTPNDRETTTRIKMEKNKTTRANDQRDFRRNNRKQTGIPNRTGFVVSLVFFVSFLRYLNNSIEIKRKEISQWQIKL